MKKKSIKNSSSRKKTTANISNAKNTSVKDQSGSQVDFPIVGIGASAGGLEAFTSFLHHLELDTGMAFVLIQHLDPKRESMLKELLARQTSLPVLEATDGKQVEPNTIYIIPPNANLALLHGHLHLMPRMTAPAHNMPIDYFFRTLAEDQGSKSLGIILSGTASDGVLGLKAIKAEGGITFAQDEKSAKYDGMPHSAIAAGCVDLILPPDKIALELARIAKHPYIKPRQDKQLKASEKKDGNEYNKIFILLRRHFDVDFTYYKHTTIQRRIKRRMMLHKINRLADYVKYLESNHAEIEALFSDLLINVTEFFREADSFESLKSSVFPSIIKNSSYQDKAVRIWIPGCSTGEEVYSIAMVLLEYLDNNKLTNYPIQMFATDIDEAAIEKARLGVYAPGISAQVSAERLQQFFTKVDQGYQINKHIRDLCIFAKQNIFKDPPFSRIDIISCRNLLIYLGPVLQKRVLSIFHYALNPGAFLLLGSAETAGESADLFRLVDQKQKIYSKKSTAKYMPLEFSMPEFLDSTDQAYAPQGLVRPTLGGADLQHLADKQIMQRYAPPGVVINEQMEILQFRGQTGEFLEPAPGEASLNLLKMARNGLSVDLRVIVNSAIKEKTTIRKNNIRYKHNGQVQHIGIEVTPLLDLASNSYFYLVLFLIPQEDSTAADVKTIEPTNIPGTSDNGQEVEILRQELAATKEYLQSVIEQQETSNEELRSANEEIQSSNEELQSINEELETAKEELQSTNEELATVNDELESRNTELNRLNDDHRNLISSANIAMVMVGNDLRIRRYTPLAEKQLNLIPTDVGRPITDVAPNINIPDLKDWLLESIDRTCEKGGEFQDDRKHWYSVRIRPYKTTDNKIDGAVITYIDVNELKTSLEIAKNAQEYAEAIISVMRHPLLVLDKDLRVLSVSQAYLDSFKVSSKETIGNLLYRLGNGQWAIPKLRTELEKAVTSGKAFNHFEVEHDFERIGHQKVRISGRQIPVKPALVLMQIEQVNSPESTEY